MKEDWPYGMAFISKLRGCEEGLGHPTLEPKMADYLWGAQNLPFGLCASLVSPEIGSYNPDSPLLCQFSRSFSPLYALWSMTWVLCFKWGALPSDPPGLFPRVYGVKLGLGWKQWNRRSIYFKQCASLQLLYIWDFRDFYIATFKKWGFVVQ